MKSLPVGQAPGPNTDPDRPLAPLPRSSAGGRLAEDAKWGFEVAVARFQPKPLAVVGLR